MLVVVDDDDDDDDNVDGNEGCYFTSSNSQKFQLKYFVFYILQEMDQNVDNLEKDKKHLNSELEEKRVEITNLQGRIKEQDQEIGSKLMEIVQMEDSMDYLKDELEDVLTSYHNDREWWKQRADKVLG